MDQFTGIRPTLRAMNRIEIRDIKRIGDFYFQVSDLGDDELRAAMYSTKLEMGDGGIVTAGEISGRYKLIEICDASFNRKHYSRPDKVTRDSVAWSSWRLA